MDFKNYSNYYFAVLLAGIAFAAVFGILFFLNSDTAIKNNPAGNMEAKFASLKMDGTNLCASATFIENLLDQDRLQGSCCSEMYFHRYSEQIDGLKKFSNIELIPSDPYDVPATIAKKLLEYKKNILLSAEQQAIYDEAMKLSHEGGPCCCKCWRWDAFEGLAKYLITKYNSSAEQIAKVWDLEDGCGGKGHAGHTQDAEL